MGRQDGVIKINGQVGGISFYKSKDNGYLARQKGGVDSSRLKNDPAFERTRENGAEFGRAGKASKVLRTAFRNLLINAADSKVVSRLTREMIRVVQSDATHVRGQRSVAGGDAALLAGFEFNQNAKLAGTFFAPFTPTVDRTAGTLGISIADFVPANMIAAPAGATHFKLISGGAEIEFEDGTYVVDTQVSDAMPLWPQVTTIDSLTHAVTPGSTKPLFLVLGVEFYQEVNGEQYPLKNGAHNALALVVVEASTLPSLALRQTSALSLTGK
jgi:hypothetical protein